MADLLDTDWNHWPDGLTRPEIAESAARLGAAGLELGVYDVAEELASDRLAEWRRLSARHRLPIRMLLFSMPPERWPDGGLASAAGRDRMLTQMDAVLDVASNLNLETVGLWPGADGPDADKSEVGRTLAELAALAARRDVRIAVEPKPDTAVSEPADVAELVEQTGHAGHIGLLLDTGHEHAAGREPADLVARFAGHLFHVHLGDSDGDPDADLPPGRLHPLEPFLAALDGAQYSGAMSPDAYGAVAVGVVTGTEAFQETADRIAAYRRATD
jgi:sugar phosphate isomerase/epimerase